MMDITISIPAKEKIFSNGILIEAVKDGEPWTKSQLGEYANSSGVYIMHSNNEILYIGKCTEGPYGNFGERFRRHCQKRASKNSRVYQMLVSKRSPVRAYLFDLCDIDMMIDDMTNSLTRKRKALILEQVLIGIYKPSFNKS